MDIKMKVLLLILGIVATVIATAASFASAANYQVEFALFALTLGCNVFAIACFAYFGWVGGRIWTILVPVLLIVYTSADVILRMTLGIRVLDMFG